MAACIAVSGALTYVYLALVARSLPAAEYAEFGAYWSIALVVGFGAFLPVEHELARLVHLRPPGALLPPGTLRTVAWTTGGVLLALAAGWPLLRSALGGSGPLLAALVVLCLASGAQFVLRGLLLGRGAVGRHGAVLVADAALRVLAAAGVAAWGAPDTAGDFGWTLVAAVVLAHVPLLTWLLLRRPARSRPDRSTDRVHPRSIAHLMVGSFSAQALLNAAPVLVTAAATTGPERVLAAQFVAGFTLVRLPLFVAVPLQGALIPSLTEVSRRPEAARRLVLRTATAVTGLTAAGALLGWLAGPFLVRLLFGARYVLPGGDLAVLAAGSGLYLGLLVTGQSLLAAARHRDVALAWACGLVVAVGVFATVPELVPRAGLAFALGSGAGFATSLVLLLRRREPSPMVPAGRTDEKGGRA